MLYTLVLLLVIAGGSAEAPSDLCAAGVEVSASGEERPDTTVPGDASRTAQALQVVTEELAETRRLVETLNLRLNVLDRARVTLQALDPQEVVHEDVLGALLQELDSSPVVSEQQNTKEKSKVLEKKWQVAGNLPAFLFESALVPRLDLSSVDGVAPGSQSLLMVPVRGGARNSFMASQGYPENFPLLWATAPERHLSYVDVFRGTSGVALGQGAIVEKDRPRKVLCTNANRPHLFSIDARGNVDVLNMTVTIDGRLITGSKFFLDNSDSNTDTDPDSANEIGTKVHLDILRTFNICGEKSCYSMDYLKVVNLRRQSVLLSYAEEVLRVHRVDGSLWTHFPSKVPPQAIATNSIHVAVSSGNAVVLMAPGSGEGVKHKNCDVPRETNVVSLSFDNVLPMVLYAGTDKGQILVFHTRSKPSGNSATVCRVVHYLPVSAAASTERGPVNVATVTGYLIAAVGDVALIYNTTGTGISSPVLLATHVSEKASTRDERKTELPDTLPVLEATPLSTNTKSTSFLVAWGPRGANSLELFESLLPYSEEVAEVSWLRVPLTMGFGVVVFFWQFLRVKGRSKHRSSYNHLGVNSRGFKGLDPEMERLIKSAQRELVPGATK